MEVSYAGFEDVFFAIDELNELELLIQNTKAKMSAKKNELAELIRSKRGIDNQDLVHIAWQLHWMHQRWTRVSDISIMCDNDEEMVKAFRSAAIEAKCSVCGCAIKVSVRSRSAFNWESKRMPSICNDCRTEREKPLIEKWAAEQKHKEEERRKELELLKTMPYAEYLQTEHWKTVRQRALKRAGFKCQLCNAQDYLNVHHKTYERRGEEENGDLIVLCRKCHAKFHEIEETQNDDQNT